MLMLLICFLYFLSSINSMTFNFERTIAINDSIEVVSGTIYYSPEGKSIVEVNSPILQYMIFEKNIWKVYYPEDKYAYVFKGESEFQIPFVDIFFSSLKEDFGLVELGYELANYEFLNDTIISIWSNQKLNEYHLIKLLQVKEKYISFELIIRDSTFLKTTFLKHYQYNDKFIPVEISSEIHGHLTNENEIITEKIQITNLSINTEFPEKIKKFEIPSEIDIKELDK